MTAFFKSLPLCWASVLTRVPNCQIPWSGQRALAVGAGMFRLLRFSAFNWSAVALRVMVGSPRARGTQSASQRLRCHGGEARHGATSFSGPLRAGRPSGSRWLTPLATRRCGT
jgi:hypothetical protein